MMLTELGLPHARRIVAVFGLDGRSGQGVEVDGSAFAGGPIQNLLKEPDLPDGQFVEWDWEVGLRGNLDSSRVGDTEQFAQLSAPHEARPWFHHDQHCSSPYSSH
jgi:hypothetical protein